MSLRQFRWKIFTAVTVAILTLSISVEARPGDGVQSDNGWKMVPALTLAGRYTTNVYRTSDSGSERGINAPIASVQPSLGISSPTGGDFLLEFDGSVRWEQYFGEGTTNAGGGVVDVSKESGLSTGLNLVGQLNPEGDVSLTLEESFNRVNEPPSTPGEESFNWITNRLGGVVGFHPGARVLTADVGYHWEVYSHSTAALEALDRQHHQFEFGSQWSFLPKTAFTLNADYGFIRWERSLGVAVRSDDPQPLVNYSSNPLRVNAGISGLLTERIALRAMTGYGWSMHEQGPSFSGVIGMAAMAYTFGRIDLGNSIQLGYKRDYRDSLAGNYMTVHKLFTSYEQHLLDQMLTLHLGGAFEFRDYSLNLDFTQSEDGSGNSLKDEALTGEAGVRANIGDWLTVDLAYDIRANFTDDELQIPVADPENSTFSVLRDYTQHSVTLSTTVRY